MEHFPKMNSISAQTIVISSLFIGINRLNTRQKASSNTTKHEEINNWQLVIYTTLVAMHKLNALELRQDKPNSIEGD